MVKKSHSEESSELSQASTSEPKAKAGSKDTTPVYELGFHIVPNVLEEALPAIVEKVRAALGGAEIISEQFPARIPLAYTVERSVQGKREKYNESYFGFIKFAMERSEMKAFEVALHSMPEVLRSLIIETVREDMPAPRRAIFNSRKLEGEIIKKPEAAPEKAVEVSDEELDKSIEALAPLE